MSVDRSLKIKGALKRHRNVLTRTERIEKLKDEEKWNDGNSLFGLPKVANRKSHAGKKAAEKPEGMPEGEAAVAGEAVAPVAGAKPAAKAPAATLAEKKKEEKKK